MADPPPPAAQAQAAQPTVRAPHKPRVVVYAQTHHLPDGRPVSLLPLLSEKTGVTHVIVAAVHLNEGRRLTLNDDPDDAPRLVQLWDEVAALQEAGVPVLAMLGGAAKGSYARLSGSGEEFEANYAVLASFLRRHRLSGIDLDVEEATTLPTMLRLIDRLRVDFGRSFLITLAPVMPALVPGGPHISGFDYFLLEAARGRDDIAWYNAQFYCGWGDASRPDHYLALLRLGGWDPRRVVLGVVTCPDNGAGYVPVSRLAATVRELRLRSREQQRVVQDGDGEGFGGVMGWEYFNGIGADGERVKPWEWVAAVGGMMREEVVDQSAPPSLLGAGAGREVLSDTAEHPFPPQSVQTLKDLGFSHQQVIAALNMTNGHVEFAAGILFES